MYNPNNSHELLVGKSLKQLFNEVNNYNWTLLLHSFCKSNPSIMNTHNKKPWWGALGTDLVLLALEVKNNMLNVGGCINPSSCEQLILVVISKICKTLELFINVFFLWIAVQCVQMCTTHLCYSHKITQICFFFGTNLIRSWTTSNMGMMHMKPMTTLTSHENSRVGLATSIILGHHSFLPPRICTL